MFNLTRPCDNCPFRKVGGIRLRRERAREIAKNAILHQGQVFQCHKTVTHDDDGEYVPTERDQYCAGALNFALNVGSLNQFMRISHRIGSFKPKAMRDRDECFGSVAEMLAAQGK